MVGWGRCWSKFRGPPGVVPVAAVVPEDHDFCFVRVELQAADSHPVGDNGHAFVEVGSRGVGV